MRDKHKPVYDKSLACKAEGWEVEKNTVWAFGKNYPLADPLAICLNAYRKHESHETRYQAMKRAYELLWPEDALTFNYWLERIFREHTNHDTEIFTLASGGGCGKAGKETTPVRTPTGWTQLKDIKVGDRICTTEGATQEVLGVYPQGVRKIYTVAFNDGSSTECDEEHLWTVYSAKQRDHKSCPQTITTLEVLKNLKKDFSLPNYCGVEGTHTEFKIHPYLMGALLGNGCLGHTTVSATFGNEETVKEVQTYWPNSYAKWLPERNTWYVGLRGIRHYLQKGGSNTKYIPIEYLYASKQQRLDLLQGLMDTDGTCNKEGTSSYTTVSPELRDGVIDLARGLGFLVTVGSKIPTYTHKGEKRLGQRAYTLQIRRTHTTKETQIFRVSYKRKRSEVPHKQYYHRKIVSVTYTEDAPAICIKVSHPNSLYLTNDYIVTHNTFAMARVAILFVLALPQGRAAIVASTELASLKNRIYGYILDGLKKATVVPPLIIANSPNPCIRFDKDDFVNGIYGVAAKKGDDDKTIAAIKGRHPKNALMLILDEATDMPVGITTAIPNLKKSLEDRFQAAALGNSKSWSDLHGSWSVPKKGIENLDPYKDFRWETTQPGGICLYFNPYDSPAIHETDPIKKGLLGKFLITEDKLLKAERDEGVDSEGFWQFTLGFWRSKSVDKTIVSEAFLKDYDPTRSVQFTGQKGVDIVAGLDPAFSTGGDKCILRLAVLGYDTLGRRVIDFRGESFVFVIKIMANTGKSAEIQIADQVIAICGRYNVSLGTLCVDASGAGRGLADVIQLRSGGGFTPTKIYSTNVGHHSRQAQAVDTVISSAHDMWFKGREFISNNQLYGLDALAYAQLHSRMIIEKTPGKKVLESKDTYKRRMAVVSSLLGRSPDEADAAMLAVQSAVLHYGFFPGQKEEIKVYDTQDAKNWAHAVEEYQKQFHKPGAFQLRAKWQGGLAPLVNRRRI